MPEYRYEAVDAAGVPVHGTADALDRDALEVRLSARNLTLISVTEQTLASLARDGRQLIPRLFQLRFGEVVREAVLTGMPVHTGLRALADEPVHHPLLSLRSWCYTLFFVGSVIALVLGWLTERSMSVVVVPILLIGSCVWAVFQLIEFLIEHGPRQQLLNMAAKLEAGEAIPDSALYALPSQVRSLMRSDAMTEESRAKIVAELMPSVLSEEVHRVKLTGRFAVALLLLPTSLIIVMGSLYTLTDPFQRMFEEFALDVPFVTRLTLSVGALLRSQGAGGPIAFSVLLLAAVAGVLVMVRRRLVWRFLSAIPILGTSLRWQVQSRIARMMAVLLGNDCPAPTAIQIASAGTQVAVLARAGERISLQLNQGANPNADDLQLLGLPVGILKQDDGQSSNDYRRTAVAAFDGLAELLETAATRQSELLVTVVSTFSIAVSAAVIGFMFFSLVIPIIKLLQALV